MTLGLTDSHAHIDFEDYDADRDAVIARYRDAGVAFVINIGITLEDSRRSVELAGQHDDIFSSVGIHPNYAADLSDATWRELEELLDRPKVVAIGETGLDFYRDHCPHDRQRDAFVRHLDLATARGLPVVIHCRDAYDACYDILRSYKSKGLRGVMHCFGGSPEDARRFAGLGLLISFAGQLTFKNADALRAAAKALQPEACLVETDCPYLAPHPLRGKRNEPANVVHTARMLAELHGLSLTDIARITTRNAQVLFGIGGFSEETLAYPIRNSLYVNVTYECNIACVFCPRESDPVVKGHYLGLERDPSVEALKRAIGDPTRYEEMVFCGFGEPMLRPGVVAELARWARQRGVKTRLNTNGLGDEIHGRPTLPDVAPWLDAVSVSLNAQSAETFVKVCKPPNGEQSYKAVLKFIEDSVACIPEVIATVVTLPSVDEEACRKIAEGMGARFRARTYNIVG